MTLPIYFSTTFTQRKAIKKFNQFVSFTKKEPEQKKSNLKILIDFPVKVMVPVYLVLSILITLTQIL